MSIKTLVLAGLVTFGSSALGQSLNFKGGYTLSSMISEDLYDMTSNYSSGGTDYTSTNRYTGIGGYNFSVSYAFNLGQLVSLETGLRYQNRGYKGKQEYLADDGIDRYSETATSRYKLNYLDIPIVLNTTFLEREHLKLYARTGIYAGYLINATERYNSEAFSSSGEVETYDFEYTWSGHDFEDGLTAGFILGVGAEYKGFYFESNYNYGVFSIANFDDGMFTSDLSFSIGYKIKFNK